jgi:glycosyltransferase involved in cell wall biosynthesis
MTGQTSPVVTVIMTTHAVDPTLIRYSLESILGQSLSDFELIVVADGALGDAEAEVLAAAKDPRVRILRPGKVGRGTALNLGVAAARSDLIAIHDSDDESHRFRLERQVRVLQQHPEIDLLATSRVLTRSRSEHADWEIGQAPDDIKIIDRELLTRNVLAHTSVMARAALFERVGGYDVSRRRFFDYDLYLRARDVGARLARLEIPLVLQRLHKRQWFASEKFVVSQMREAGRLQRSHIRRLPFLQRWWYTLLIALRVPVRSGRAYLARKRLEQSEGR